MHPKYSVSLLSDPTVFADAAALYLKVRAQEQWIYPDGLLPLLPQVPAQHPHARLWTWRRRGLVRLVRYLSHHFSETPFKVLDVGCGNGWMSHYLAKNLPQAHILGVDVNLTELEQAVRVFQRPNLQYAFADLEADILPEQQFDLVLFAGAFQYFQAPEKVLSAARRVLKPGGLVHIIDTNFYKNETAQAKAQAGTLSYYTQLNVPEMAAFYHHFLKKDIPGTDRLDTLEGRFLQKIGYLSPFPWMEIRF